MCVPSYFCEEANGITYEVVEESQITLDNWIKKYDLICAKPIIISSFSMSYFVGFAVGSIFVPTLGDIYGRKKVFLINMLIAEATMIAIPFLPGGTEKQIIPLIALLLILGISNTGRVGTGFAYMCEIAPKEAGNMIGGVWNSLEGSIYIFSTLYFMKNKNWLYPQAMGNILFFLTIGPVLYVPESPKWLFKNKRYIECYESLLKMAKFNGKQLSIATMSFLFQKPKHGRKVRDLKINLSPDTSGKSLEN
mmetsp:Transcript_16487/g.27995  ORF Transcript_16487/g.27995 Transcript_16487/m.27995 type:complete len:250 (+) Transcript_16487:334-1083(+)